MSKRKAFLNDLAAISIVKANFLFLTIARGTLISTIVTQMGMTHDVASDQGGQR